MHAITEQLLGNDKTKDIQYTVYPEMSVVVQLVRFPQIYGNQGSLQCSRKHFFHPLASHEQLQSILTYFFNTCITAPNLCIFFNSTLCYTIFPIFLFVLCCPIDTKLSLCSKYTVPSVCYIFKSDWAILYPCWEKCLKYVFQQKLLYKSSNI